MTERPSFFSLDFHVRFFPAVLWHRLRSLREGRTSAFAHHLPFEYPIILALCLVLAAAGIPPAMAGGSLIGWILGGVGILGTVGLMAQSVYAQFGTRPSFESFRVMVFLFFLLLGPSIGLVVGSGLHSHAIGALAGVAGFAAGYAVGIAGGLAVQYLGWIAALLELAAGLGAVGLVVVDLLILLG